MKNPNKIINKIKRGNVKKQYGSFSPIINKNKCYFVKCVKLAKHYYVLESDWGRIIPQSLQRFRNIKKALESIDDIYFISVLSEVLERENLRQQCLEIARHSASAI